jgi:hypothetical protein
MSSINLSSRAAAFSREWDRRVLLGRVGRIAGAVAA